MEALHSALRLLAATDIDDIPADNGELRSYMRHLLANAYLAVESVPPAASASSSKSQPEPVLQLPASISAALASGSGSSLGSGSGSGSDEATAATATSIDIDIGVLQKAWNKPINKVDNAKDNPLRIPVYKLASKDGKGAWFARRSVHTGLAFERWREKLRDEFAETMRIRERNGGSLEGGSVRGIGSERRVEVREVPVKTEINGVDGGGGGGSGSGTLGSVEVYHLSASFPGPSTPRDFVTLLITSDMTLDLSGEDECYMVISKPCKHSDAPPRKGFVRGEYESIEFIRELPGDAEDGNDDDSSGGSEKKARPVEWIMITRSDPGGSIPRWMVEKGTTPSIVNDARKFIEWAQREDQEDDQELGSNVSPLSSGGERKSIQFSDGDAKKKSDPEGESPHVANIIDGVVGLVSLGLDTITPRMVHNYLDRHGYSLHGSASHGKTYAAQNRQCVCSCHLDSQGSLNSDTLSTRTDATSPKVASDTGISVQGRKRSTSMNSTALSAIQSTSSIGQESTAGPSNKEISKLAKKKQDLEDKLAALRDEQRALRLGGETPADANAAVQNGHNDSGLSTPSRAESADGNGNIQPPISKDASKAIAAKLKRLSSLEHKEAKLMSQIAKVESQQEKAVAQAEAKQHKEAQKNEKRVARTELESLKDEMRRLKIESSELREERQKWMELVGTLQKENTRLAAEKQDEETAQKIS